MPGGATMLISLAAALIATVIVPLPAAGRLAVGIGVFILAAFLIALLKALVGLILIVLVIAAAAYFAHRVLGPSQRPPGLR